MCMPPQDIQDRMPFCAQSVQYTACVPRDLPWYGNLTIEKKDKWLESTYAVFLNERLAIEADEYKPDDPSESSVPVPVAPLLMNTSLGYWCLYRHDRIENSADTQCRMQRLHGCSLRITLYLWANSATTRCFVAATTGFHCQTITHPHIASVLCIAALYNYYFESVVRRFTNDDDCQAAYRNYLCYMNFPRCNGAEESLSLCLSVCENFFQACAYPKYMWR